MVGQGHSRREVHLYAVMDVFLFDQAGWCRYIKNRQEGVHQGETHVNTAVMQRMDQNT